MESRAITDGQISASTIWSSYHVASNARLHNQASANSSGAWEPSKKNANQWLQIDLVTQLSVTRVATQGREDRFHWVTKYHLQYSNNGSTFQFRREQGKHFSKVSHWANIWTCSLFNTKPCWPQTWSITYVCCLKELSGNTDSTTVVSHDIYSTNHGALHSFPTIGLALADSHESGAVWLPRYFRIFKGRNIV